MRKRNPNQKYSGSILDAPSHIDERAWENDNILTKVKEAKEAPVCHCPGTSSSTYLGGCKPSLRWADSQSLEAFCAHCFKPLSQKVHKRRQQSWVLGLASTYNKRPGQIDLDSISDLFVTGGSPPANILD